MHDEYFSVVVGALCVHLYTVALFRARSGYIRQGIFNTGLNYGLIASMWPIKLSQQPDLPSLPKTIAIVGKYFAAGISESLTEVADFLQVRGHKVVFEAETAQNIA